MMFNLYTKILNSEQDKPVKSSFFRRGFYIYIAIILMIVGFGVGILVGEKRGEIRIISGEAINYGQVVDKSISIPEYLGKDVKFKIFWDVWNTVQSEYIDRPVGETKLFYGALAGMVNGLEDPFSDFFEPKKADEFYQEMNGEFEGIGAELEMNNGAVTVVTPLAGSPAEQAGLRPADIIVEVAGESTVKMNLVEAVERIRGEKGSAVELKIFRPKTSEFLDFKITRDVIRIVSVSWKLLSEKQHPLLVGKKVALLEITNFNSDTEERFNKAVNEIILANPEALILDLRGNPGGYLNTAVTVASAWVTSGDVVVMEKDNQGEISKEYAEDALPLRQYKTVALINGGSASSAEILAGALQDYKLATLIGEKSFGKGSVQKMIEFDDGSAVKLTFARWLTPQGRQIDKEGITPDIAVEMTEEDYKEDSDPQMERAIEFLIKGE